MTGRIVEISTAATRLSVKHEQLVITQTDKEDKTVPIEDIALLLLNHPSITLSQAVPTRLAEHKAAIIFCGLKQLPVSLSLPIESNTLQGERLHQQMTASRPLQKRLWQSIIKCKIDRQADILEIVNNQDGGLRAMARRVKSGDADNLEAQAAQRYWPALMGHSFRRNRFGDSPNHLLNYGYSILRSAIARNICTSGLHPGIGLFHHNRSNSFPLADDLLEVFRPLLDLRVKQIADTYDNSAITQEHKANILSLLNETIILDGGEFPTLVAMQRITTSLAKSFESNCNRLLLPEKFTDSTT